MTTIACPYCHNQIVPQDNKKISTLGIVWIILAFFSCFLTLFLLLLPSSWEYTKSCPKCGMKL